jgi:hypothetical protein
MITIQKEQNQQHQHRQRHRLICLNKKTRQYQK